MECKGNEWVLPGFDLQKESGKEQKEKKTFVETPEVGYSAKGPMNVTTERTGEQALSSSFCIPKFNDPSMQLGKQAQH